MPDPTSLINLGDLTKPATVLIEKISDAIGSVFAPYQTVRLARAEADADRIRAQARMDVSDIEERAFRRLLKEEGRKQANIEEVTRRALPQLDHDATPEAIDNDWLLNFFDKCRLTSDDDLQNLWSRILAGEANRPGRFSRRTLNFLATLEKFEAEQFTALCAFSWSIGRSDDFVPLVFDTDTDVYKDNGVNYETLIHLASIGLVRYQSLGIHEDDLPRQPVLTYFDRQVKLNLPGETRNKLELGVVIFTRMGLELAPISGAQPLSVAYDYTVAKWRREGLSPEAPPVSAAG